MNPEYDPDYGNPYNDDAVWEDAHHYTEVDPMDLEPLDFEQEEYTDAPEI